MIYRLKAQDVTVGMEISLHGTVEKIEPMIGRSLFQRGKVMRHAHKQPKGFKLIGQGQEGFSFKTEQGEFFYAVNASVPVVQREITEHDLNEAWGV